MKAMMKALMVLILTGLSISPSDAAFNKLTPEKLALAQQIVALDNSQKMLQATIQSVILQARSKFPSNTPEQFFSDLEQNIDQKKMLNDLVQVYGSIYSEQDMKALIAFYQSAEGQRVATKFPDIVIRLSELSNSIFSDALNETLQQSQSSTAP